MRPTPSIVVALTCLIVGCAGGSAAAAGATPSQPTEATRPARGPANQITSAEVEAAGSELRNALELVQRLRPAMLRSRVSSPATDGSTDVMAYVDGVKLGTWRALQQVSRVQVREIRYHSPSEATQKWGTGHLSGAIEVIARR